MTQNRKSCTQIAVKHNKQTILLMCWLWCLVFTDSAAEFVDKASDDGSGCQVDAGKKTPDPRNGGPAGNIMMEQCALKNVDNCLNT